MLVRGSNCAAVPGPFASMGIVALLPFAENLLLNGDITINISGSKELIEETNLKHVAEEIEKQLRGVQLSYDGKVSVTAIPSDAAGVP